MAAPERPRNQKQAASFHPILVHTTPKGKKRKERGWQRRDTVGFPMAISGSGSVSRGSHFDNKQEFRKSTLVFGKHKENAIYAVYFTFV